MKLAWVALAVILVTGIIVFYSVNKGSQDKEQSEIQETKIKDLSSIILTVDDFPKGEEWQIKDRVERGKSDLNEQALMMGWKRGYMASYLRGDLTSDNLDYSRVDLFISEYPVENISFMVGNNADDETVQYDRLSDLEIGDDSRAYKAIETDEYGTKSTYYEIHFRKENLLVTLLIYGTRTDYELLKSLAKKVEVRIN